MTVYAEEDFDGGTNGVALSTSNTSSDLIGGTAPTFSNDAHEGALSMYVNQGASAASSARFQLGALRSLVYVGFWLKAAAWPTSNAYPLGIRSGSTPKTDFRLPNGIPAMRGGGTGATLVWTAPGALPTGEWLYLEHRVDDGDNTQQFRAFAEDGTVLLDSGSQAWAAASTVDNIVLGLYVAAATVQWRIDGLIVADESFAPTPPPPAGTHYGISGGLLVPMTVSPL